MSKDERIEYLEDERKKIWLRLTYVEDLIKKLEDLLKKKTSDYEEDAKAASEQAVLYKKSIEEANDAIAEILSEATTKLETLRTNHASFEEMFLAIKANSESSIANGQLIGTIYKNIEDQAEKVEEQIAEIQKIFDGKPALDEKILRLETVFKKGDEYDSKLGPLFKSITERKKEIDELYFEIIGYTEEDENGVKTEVKGQKDELANSFEELKGSVASMEERVKIAEQNLIKSYTDFTSEKGQEFASLNTKWNTEYSQVLKRIEALLPQALTTGLSFAYSEKKVAEEKESSLHSKSFNSAIIGLIAISSIPVLISIVSILQKTELEEVILRIPRIVLGTFPLYLPVLWLAYSANRRMNLAKRLIEEYSHKEVLSKTYEGLSKQIDTITDSDISSDLRIKLLYNILEVSSENPGKLISDYNKSDHPLMDALDKSIKLTNAVTKLSKIPGFTKLASSLERKSKIILEEENKKASAGLESVSENLN